MRYLASNEQFEPYDASSFEGCTTGMLSALASETDSTPGLDLPKPAPPPPPPPPPPSPVPPAPRPPPRLHHDATVNGLASDRSHIYSFFDC